MGKPFRLRSVKRILEPATPKLFGRYHEIVILLLGFVLTSFVGGYITYAFQERSWSRDDRAKRKQEDFVRASTTYDEISKVLDKRQFRLRRILDTLGERRDLKLGPNGEDRLKELRVSYRAAVDEWNEQLNRNLAAVETYYGLNSRRVLESDIQVRFIALQKTLNMLLENRESTTQDAEKEFLRMRERALRDLDEINTTVYLFNVDLLRRLRSGNFLPAVDFYHEQSGAADNDR